MLFVEIFNIIAYIHIHIHAHTQICVCVSSTFHMFVTHMHGDFKNIFGMITGFQGFTRVEYVFVCCAAELIQENQGEMRQTGTEAFELENSIGRESQAEHWSRGNSSWHGMPHVLDGSCGKVTWAEDETSLLSGRDWCVLVRQGFTWRLWILEPGVKM